MTALVFLDTETTGLDPALHEVWEVAVAVDDGPVQTYHLQHQLWTADPKALELNGYYQRRIPNRSPDYGIYADVELRQRLEGATIVGANPAFDTSFLRARWGASPWHHRLIDVESMALALLQYERPKGLHALAADLRNQGFDVPVPDHTAAADVETTRAAYKALRTIAGGAR